jgi:hypothetical protein
VEESGVTLAPVSIIHLGPSWNILLRLDTEPIPLAIKEPFRVARGAVIQHVSVWHETDGLLAVHGEAKKSTLNKNDSFLECLEWMSLSESVDQTANDFIIGLLCNPCPLYSLK